MAALTLAMRRAHFSHLSISASKATSNRMSQILDRLQIEIHRQLVLPCCLQYADQDRLPAIDSFRYVCWPVPQKHACSKAKLM